MARLHYLPRENDRQMMRSSSTGWWRSRRRPARSTTGCRTILDADGVYRTPAWHLLGTCRMGDDPDTSVVNKWHQCWDVPNLFIVDGSALATGGVVNPTSTISALALRAAEHLRDNFRDLSATTRPEAA